jgi:hypothetical protein
METFSLLSPEQHSLYFVQLVTKYVEYVFQDSQWMLKTADDTVTLYVFPINRYLG